ncbi:transcription factor IBH1-like 1 [Durio zibethinus]|uniref:Transcription factor IBH1-like 1 n=1 Tax=Durio zibethinus TaxID=66656 RepID=A0A6P5XK85_DURZI|nr:transcription factor IBH1-like 1 [Durio zibethinus]
MRPPSSLRQEFLKKWMMGLQRYSTSKKNMSILERKKAIKLSADVAIASARNGTTCWSRALIANGYSKDGGDDKHLVEQILGPESERLIMKKVLTGGASVCNKRMRSKKILKRSCGIQRTRKFAPQVALASSIAKRLVRKRTQILRSLIPGGEFMNDVTLIEETLDYIISLRAQVDVMRSLASASELASEP